MNWLHRITQHYRSDTALADVFGVVLYTDEHPYTKKVLKDSDFWMALDKQSGTEWAIFSIMPKQGSYQFPDFDGEQEVLCQLMMIWKEPDENIEVLDYLGIESTESLPVLVIYTHDEDNNILKLIWKIDESSKDNAYNSLSKGVKIISKAIDGVLTENRKYGEGVFRAIEMAVNQDVTIQRIKKGINFYSYLKSLSP